MPNWCENKLTITGSKKELNSFKKKAVQRSLSSVKGDHEVLYFYNFYNVNEEEADLYWQIKNFGVKWGCDQSVLTNESSNELSYAFGTPWSAPDSFLKHVSTMFTSLTFELEYIEIGCRLGGSLIIKNGEILNCNHHEDEQFLEWLKERYPDEHEWLTA